MRRTSRPRPGLDLKAMRKNPDVARFEKDFAQVAGTNFDLHGLTIERPRGPMRVEGRTVVGQPNIDFEHGYLSALMGADIPAMLLPSEGEHHFEFGTTPRSKGKPRRVPVAPGKRSNRSRALFAKPLRVVIRKVGDEHELELQDYHKGERRYRPTYVWFVNQGTIIDGEWGVKRENH